MGEGRTGSCSGGLEEQRAERVCLCCRRDSVIPAVGQGANPPNPWLAVVGTRAGHLGWPRAKLSSYMEQSPDILGWKAPLEASSPTSSLLVSSGVTPGHSGAGPAHKTLRGLRQHPSCSRLPPSPGNAAGREGGAAPALCRRFGICRVPRHGENRDQGAQSQHSPGASPMGCEGFRCEIRNIRSSHCVTKAGVRPVCEEPSKY